MKRPSVSSQTVRLGDQTYTLSEGEEHYTLQARPGGFFILEDRRSGERTRVAGVSSVDGRGQVSWSVWFDGRLWDLKMPRKQARGAATSANGDLDFHAQFPGRIRKILVKPGAAVAAGETLLLVEAMKMEFAIKAPESGKVSRFLVEEGQAVSPGVRYLEWSK